MLEIELKVQVDDLAPIRSHLLALGAPLSRKTTEHDCYYNAPHCDLASRDEALRIRSDGSGSVVTFKGPKRRELAFKAREELATTIGDGAILGEILKRLGFVEVAIVRKLREDYPYRGATVSLDQVEGLGSFVEIEVIVESGNTDVQDRIDSIRHDLGLGERRPLLSSYLELILARQ